MMVRKLGLITQEEVEVPQVKNGLERDLITVLIPFTQMIVRQLPQISHLTDIYIIGMQWLELLQMEELLLQKIFALLVGMYLLMQSGQL